MAIECPVSVSSTQPVGNAPVITSAERDELRVDALDYRELRQLVRQAGLLDRQPGYYLYKVPFTVGLLAASIAFLVLVDSLWLQLANAAFMGLVFSQLGLIGHDAGHQQIFSSVRKNDLVSLMIAFLMALVPSWWNDKHNQRHHGNPNRIRQDGDIDVSVFAFTIARAFEKTGFPKAMARYQSFMFFPVLILSSIIFLFAGIHYVLTGRPLRYRLVEPLLMVVHLAVYFALLFTMLEPLHAVLFFAVHQAVEGFYMGSVFAPNHKGMPVLDQDTPMGFLRQQVITSRDVSAHPITDFIYGGLNYQIEHHLFPNMPRNNLRKAQPIVREFCRARSIPYHETSFMQSQREILGYMQKMGAPCLRQPGRDIRFGADGNSVMPHV